MSSRTRESNEQTLSAQLNALEQAAMQAPENEQRSGRSTGRCRPPPTCPGFILLLQNAATASGVTS